MQLALTDEEADALRQLLERSLAELKGEIHDTDNVSFRRGLERDRATLEAIQARLRG